MSSTLHNELAKNDSDQTAEEELQVLNAIYGDELQTIEPENNIFELLIHPCEFNKSNDTCIILRFQFVDGYPSTESLQYELRAPWAEKSLLDKLNKQIREIICNNAGSPVVHLIVESIRSFILPDHVQLTTKKALSNEPPNEPAPQGFLSVFTVPSIRTHLNMLPNLLPMAISIKPPKIYHGDPFCDRKSIFQAHCAAVTTAGEVSSFISTVLSDRKVFTATHNILAWRVEISVANGTRIASDWDDDGETHAGSRLLHLLTLSETKNVAVVVSRWYGGIQLGPDRFKHINSVAKTLLLDCKLLHCHSNKFDGRNKPAKSK